MWLGSHTLKTASTRRLQCNLLNETENVAENFRSIRNWISHTRVTFWPRQTKMNIRHSGYDLTEQLKIATWFEIQCTLLDRRTILKHHIVNHREITFMRRRQKTLSADAQLQFHLHGPLSKTMRCVFFVCVYDGLPICMLVCVVIIIEKYLEIFSTLFSQDKIFFD